ncbi:DUF1127 domain-containing protein [Bradyrhizobium sp. 44]|uniref:DUF1127 domain-containing protein n=1 Tax=Bradyrhizobium sp. 44 TaxID=2782675 RepID=UPI001FF7F004
MVLAFHDQIVAQTQPQPHDPLRLGRGRSRALEFDDDTFSPGPAGIGRGLLFGHASLPAQQQEHAMPPQQTNITSQTEGLPVELVSTWGIPGLLARYWRALQDWRWRHGPQIALQDLSDRQLMDIGLTRGEVDYIAPERAIDALRDRATHPWGRGVM